MATEPLAFPPAIGDPWGDTFLADLPVVAFDTETGGFDPFAVPLLTVGCASPDGLALEITVRHEHYQPDEKVLSINRITGARAAGGCPWLLIEPLLEEQFDGRVVVGHNIGFDFGFLVANSPAMSLPPAIDTAAICRFLWPGEKADLASLCRRARVENADAHGAGADALAAMRGWVFLRNILRDRGVTTWNKLCEAQAPIPDSMRRGAWPSEVAAMVAKARKRGATNLGGSASA